MLIRDLEPVRDMAHNEILELVKRIEEIVNVLLTRRWARRRCSQMQFYLALNHNPDLLGLSIIDEVNIGISAKCT